MTHSFDSTVYNDPKIKETLEMLAQGSSKEDITKHFGNKDWKTIYIYFSRRGFKWEGKGNTFIPKVDDTEENELLDGARFTNTKAGKIVRQLSQQKTNIRQVSQRNGFKTVEEMGEYMKGQGYIWDSEQNNYDYDEVAAKPLPPQPALVKQSLSINHSGQDEYQQLLQFLLSKQDKLVTLLDSNDDGTLPRYKFRGGKVNKTLALPTSLQTLLGDFSEDFNLTQRAIVEIALAEFFKKYGYEEQLNQALQL
jgi:hypothetical protein